MVDERMLWSRRKEADEVGSARFGFPVRGELGFELTGSELRDPINGFVCRTARLHLKICERDEAI